MTGKETLKFLIEDAGLDEATAKALMDNEKVSTRAGQLKQESEYKALQDQTTALQTSYAKAKNYEDWYEKNYGAIQDRVTRLARYEERYGALDENTPVPQQKQAPQFDEAAIAKMVDTRIQSQYGPQWSNLLKGSGKLIEKHIRSGRKSEIDWDKVSELAAAKGGDLVAGYDEWDAPERIKADESAKENEINRRVKEQLAKQRTNDFFPAGADGSSSTTESSPLSRSRAEAPKYNRQAVVDAARTGKYEGFKEPVQ